MADEKHARSLVVCASHSPGMLRDTEELYGHVFRDGVIRAAERVAEFAPDLVVFFGSDHRRAFVDSIPSIAIMAQADGLGDLGSPKGRYDVPSELSVALADYLLGQSFDVALVRKIALDHGFGQSYTQLVGELQTVPVVPIYINCATPPLAAPSRAHELGSAVGDFFIERDVRVLYVGSGGLSHSPPSLAVPAAGISDAERLAINEAGRAAAGKKIRPDWDKEFLRRLTEEPGTLKELADEDLASAGVGAHEVRTWIAAVSAGGTPMEIIAYEPVSEWITGMGVVASKV